MKACPSIFVEVNDQRVKIYCDLECSCCGALLDYTFDESAGEAIAITVQPCTCTKSKKEASRDGG